MAIKGCFEINIMVNACTNSALGCLKEDEKMGF